MTSSRVPSGVPAGGQFASQDHQETDVNLGCLDGWAEYLDEYPEVRLIGEAVSKRTPIYFAGGWVRDLASGRAVNDNDLTSALTPDQFRAAVANVTGQPGVSVFDVGEEHGTTGVVFERPDGTRVEIEHTTHRTEVYTPDSRAPEVGFGTDLQADLERRDFTMNAVAVDVMTGKVVDPFGGLDDLAAGVLRTPTDPDVTFQEDPLRICRMARFSSTRGFVVDPETAAAASRQAGRLGIVSAERKRTELTKIMAAGPTAAGAAIELCDELGIRDEVLCGLGDTASPADLYKSRAITPTDTLAALAYRSSDSPKALLGLKFTNFDQAQAKATVAASAGLGARGPEFRALLRSYGHETVVSASRIAPGVSDSEFSRIQSEIVENKGFDWQPLPVDGNDLLAAGLKGRAIGSALRDVEAAMCVNPKLTRDEALQVAASSGGDR